MLWNIKRNIKFMFNIILLCTKFLDFYMTSSFDENVKAI